ncbi:hypothetical protein STVIR_4207 [Streptomyces viridochromogenes Tue57]|uniref:Calcium-binding protein n=2 Tax=Streptomyces viridochromogenes TaxID=1938 RepID=L8PF36_STRVR|nr:hypothetical protein STVIR_4207 [Streptomyces viridochromogenes Tue57]
MWGFMRSASIGAVLTGALALCGSALTVAPAHAAETGVEIKKVSVNGGKSIVFGISRTESFTISVTASDDSGISKDGAFLQIEREKGDDYWSYHGVPSCTAASTTTSTCKLTVQLERDIDLPRNTLAGPWNVYVQLSSKDGDLYSDVHGTHPVKRRSTLNVDASPEPVAKGKTITVTGKLARANWDRYVYAGYTYQSVQLQFRPKDSSTYTTVKTVKTDGSGKLRTGVTANRDGYWRWNFAGTATTAAVRTAGDFVDVR